MRKFLFGITLFAFLTLGIFALPNTATADCNPASHDKHDCDTPRAGDNNHNFNNYRQNVVVTFVDPCTNYVIGAADGSRLTRFVNPYNSNVGFYPYSQVGANYFLQPQFNAGMQYLMLNNGQVVQSAYNTTFGNRYGNGVVVYSRDPINCIPPTVVPPQIVTVYVTPPPAPAPVLQQAPVVQAAPIFLRPPNTGDGGLR